MFLTKLKKKKKKLSKRKIKKTLKWLNKIAKEDIRTFRGIARLLDEKGLDFVVDSNDVIIGITESTEAMETTEAMDLKEIIRRMDERR